MEVAELTKKKFVITAELGPPKGTNMEPFFKQAAYLKGHVHAANVTDGQSALMKMGSLAACHRLKDFGIEPIMQITCRDRNRLAIQSDLLSAACLGLENILVLTGDHPVRGDHPQAMPVFDLDSVQLLQAASGLKQGFDMNKNK